jgi:4-hydroxy-tetrahydrodipicolinate reductase
MTLRIAIHGAAGRMGLRLVALAAADKELELVSAIDVPNHPRLGEDVGILAGVGKLGVPLSASIDAGVQVVVDFTVPKAGESIVEICREKKIPLVTATTGYDERQMAKIRDAAKEIPLLWAPSMSLAVNLTMKLAETAALALRIRMPTSRLSSGTIASRKIRRAGRH